MRKLLSLFGKIVEVFAGALGGLIVAAVVMATGWYFHVSGDIGTAPLVLVALVSGLIFPVLGMCFRRAFILFTEPFANLVTLDEIVDSNSSFAEFFALLAYVLSLILIVCGAIWHSAGMLFTGLSVFIGYGLTAPRVFRLRLEGDPPPDNGASATEILQAMFSDSQEDSSQNESR